MMCQCGFINCHKCTSSVSDVDNEQTEPIWGRGYVRLFLHLSQLCYKFIACHKNCLKIYLDEKQKMLL